MISKITMASLFALALFSCKNRPESQTLEASNWYAFLQLNDSTTLPFALERDSSAQYILHNGAEKIILQTALETTDSLVLNFPVYQARLCISLKKDEASGYFEDMVAEDYKIPFTARNEKPMVKLAEPCCPIATTWQTTFTAGEKITPAIGEFYAEGNDLRGTFLTQSGDYRYLHGYISGQHIMLYGFDGGYIQVFAAKLESDTLRGTYHSGKTGFRTWVAWPNESVVLPDGNQLSQLNPAIDSISFAYPNIAGDTLRYNPAAFLGKVVMIQITGSWCPNCKDQAQFMQQLYDAYAPEKLAVMAVAFERSGTIEKSMAAAKKAKTDLNITYPTGLAQYSSAQKAEEVFPFLDKIRAYPTLIIIDKKGAVRKIYTGFAGPGTSKYTELTAELANFTKTLIDE